MSQHDMVLDNASGAVFRADANAAVAALVSLSSGTTEPSTAYAYQLWADTTTGLLKQRNSANNAWVSVARLADSAKCEYFIANAVKMTLNSFGLGIGKVPTTYALEVQGDVDVTGSFRINGTSIGSGGNLTVDSFSGTGAQVAFTLTATPGSINNTFVYVSGVYQNKSTYSVVGTTLTFSTAPPVGTNNIQVVTGTTLSLTIPADASVTPAKLNVTFLKSEYIPATLIRPFPSGGCAALADTALSGFAAPTLAFDAALDEKAYFMHKFPNGWDRGTITAKFHWSHAAATAYVCRWVLGAQAISDDDAMSNAETAQAAVNDTGGTTNDLYISAATSALTIALTPAAGDVVMFAVTRNGSSGADTLDVDARLHGIELLYTINTFSDA